MASLSSFECTANTAANTEIVEETDSIAEEYVAQAERNEATHQEVNKIEREAEKAVNPLVLDDEFCSDKDYIENDSDTDTIVDKIVVKPDDDWTNAEVKNVIDYKLKCCCQN